MRLNTTLNRLSLIALLSIGLTCAPLAVNADNGERGWHGHHQQDHGKRHHRTDYRSDQRDYAHHKTHGYRDSCRMNDVRGYKTDHGRYRPHGYGSHHAGIHRHYRSGHQLGHLRVFPGVHPGGLAVLLYD
jgi:hypothetical protein